MSVILSNSVQQSRLAQTLLHCFFSVSQVKTSRLEFPSWRVVTIGWKYHMTLRSVQAQSVSEGGKWVQKHICSICISMVLGKSMQSDPHSNGEQRTSLIEVLNFLFSFFN